jgi:FixJ family two-component response regulator
MTPTPTAYVVDDDALMLSALRRVFSAALMPVETFSSARALLDACPPNDDPAVLVLDVKMPGMTGLELQRELVARGMRHPIVFLTGSGDVPMAVEAMRMGAADFLEKPFDNARLVERVRHAFAGARRAPAGGDPNYARNRARLTPREREVMDTMLTGKTNKLIARELGMSHRTVEIHRSRVMEKMEVRTLADLVRSAIASGQP